MPRKSEPAHIGARRHGQEGTFALLIPLWKCCEVFCALVVTAKRSVDELFMHYFYNVSSASGGFAADLHRGSIPDPAGGLLSSDP